MTQKESMKNYREKRDFSHTPEPTWDMEKSTGKKPIFVIQKHDASRLHYDFRIEVDGVLKSWAVPKGPSTDPKVKRLAVPTEDHPLAYAGFEGTIPEGQYGGGTVMVWDTGTYRNLREEKKGAGHAGMPEAIRDGRIEIWLEGKKLKGGYALIRTGMSGDEKWLMIKMKDSEAEPDRDPVKMSRIQPLQAAP